MKIKAPQALIDLFLLDLHRRQGSLENHRKLVLVNTICIVAIVVLVMVAMLSFVRGHRIIGALDFSAAILLSLCLLYLRRTGRHRLPILVGIGIMTSLYAYLFFTGGAGGTGYLWYYTYPVFTLYLMEKKDGLVANAILLGPTIVYLIAIFPFDRPPYSQDFIIRFIPSILCVFFFAYLYEATRIMAHRRLTKNQRELEHTVTALRRKEVELKAAHDELEERIDARTRQLKVSNLSLIKEIEQRKDSEAQRRQLEAQLVRAQKMEALGTLAGGVAHDLNNILSGITSYPELLLMNLPADNPLREPLKTIEASGKKAATVVEDLLTLSRRGAPLFESLDLRQIVTDYLHSPECEKMLSFHAGMTLQTDFRGDDLLINGSAVHLSKTVMNLITNAAESMPQGGLISIGLRGLLVNEADLAATVVKPDRYIKLTVADQGTGISPDDLDHIFEPFFTTKKMGRSGTGLGMAVVWGTVKDHDGHIDVSSQPGIGTTFELLFPAVRHRPSEAPESDLVTHRGNGQRILVVDDVSEQREIATGILKALGYTTHRLPSGEAALTWLQAHSADLVLLDMAMDPGLSGLETYRRLIAFKPHQRVVIVSGFSESEPIKEALTLGVRAYLKKPYRLKAIARMVAKTLAGD